jgi:phage recombination protein Bet
MGQVAHFHAPAQSGVFTDRQLDLIRRTVANDCNSQEFDLFCEVARRTGLDPIRKQISALVFNKNKPDRRRMAIITTIDGFRAIASRSGRYRPDEEEADYVYDEDLKSRANPLGLVKASVTIWIAEPAPMTGWKPAKGWAYWDEFAPIKEECAAGYEWVETGEVWEDSGKPKKRRTPKGQVEYVVDDSGNWLKMPRLMLAKCAEAQAIRKAFPEETSGVYEAAELDRARAEELTASERIEAFSMENRLEKAGIVNTILMSISPAAGIEAVPLGQIHDRIMEALKDCDLRWLNWFENTNTVPLREFWARAKSDALAVKRALDDRRAVLVKAEAEARG